MPAICKARREVLEETNSADTLILDVQPPELKGNTFLVFKLPSHGICYSTSS